MKDFIFLIFGVFCMAQFCQIACDDYACADAALDAKLQYLGIHETAYPETEVIVSNKTNVTCKAFI